MLSLLIVLTALSVHATQRECLRVNYVSVLDSGENSQMYFNYIYSKVKVYDANGNIVDKIQGWRRSERNGDISSVTIPTKLVLELIVTQRRVTENSKANVYHAIEEGNWCRGF